MAGTPTFRQSQEFHILFGKRKACEMARRRLPTPLLLLSFGFIFSSSAIGQNNVVGQWSPVMTWPDMNDNRWYPTNTTLPNGDVLVVSGWITAAQGVNVEPQVWETATNSWRNLTTAHLALPFYPFMM